MRQAEEEELEGKQEENKRKEVTKDLLSSLSSSILDRK